LSNEESKEGSPIQITRKIDINVMDEEDKVNANESDKQGKKPFIPSLKIPEKGE
jgi:hypothetical protein